MPRTDRGGDPSCSFCGKPQHQVVKLIAGPGVHICDECIDLCNEIVEEETVGHGISSGGAQVEAAARSARQAVDRLRALALQARAVPRPPGEH